VRVLLFGTYERGYPRTAVAVSSLRRAGVDVVEHNVAVWSGRANWNAGARVAARLLAAEARLLARRPRERFDAVLVGYPGHTDLLAARRAARGAPVIFDALVSLADTLVADRARFVPGSPVDRVLAALDRHALRSADLVVADTEANAAFLRRLGRLPPDRVAVVPVGAEERLFRPGWEPRDPPLFVGKLIPLHGVETLLEAARRAPDLRIRIAGSGQLEGLVAERPGNVDWLPWIPYDALPAALWRASAALGVFGTSAKARRVIPNKAYQALACGVPLVTSDTPAARELLTDGESALLVPPGDPDALAGALRRLRDDDGLARRIAGGGLAAFREHASEAVLGRRWCGLLERLVA
jgi:glycosyltransferase involved in cell wall biosynthesis